MEEIDQRLDLAAAMAISGAAVSANMGSETIRLLSPSLALLNIRLGYWLRVPLTAEMLGDPRLYGDRWHEVHEERAQAAREKEEREGKEEEQKALENYHGAVVAGLCRAKEISQC